MTLPVEVRQMIPKELLVGFPRFMQPSDVEISDFELEFDSSDDDNDSYLRGRIGMCADSPMSPAINPKIEAYYRTDPGEAALNVSKCSGQILRVCRALRDEGTTILYANNVFDLTAFCDIPHPCSFRKTDKIFSERIGDQNWRSIRHVNVDMHYLLNYVSYAGLRLSVSDCVSWSGGFDPPLLNIYNPRDLPPLQSLKVFIPKKTLGGKKYSWELWSHDDDAEFYGFEGLGTDDTDVLGELIKAGIRDFAAFMELVIF